MESGMEEIPVKVAVRIRPLLSSEVHDNHQVCVRAVPHTQQILFRKEHAYTFDFVFGEISTQEEVYTVCIKPLLVSLTEGYNATVFAYGQTGSGKTYTIGTGQIASVAENEMGIIPRAIHELFQHISENPNVDFHVKVSYVEVYKEELRDLLELETPVKKLRIQEDKKGTIVIVGAKEFQVECADEVISLLESGNSARHTGRTRVNEHSSRSHAVFTIGICQKQSAESQKKTDAAQDSSRKSVPMIASKFHFVDLAGSERVTKTGSTGERFKESVQINSGLLVLGNVIRALGDPKKKRGHIPYRDAKITHILKDSLGGSSKTVMITCISPSSSDLHESLHSLKYANRVKNIRNKVVVNYNLDHDQTDEMELEKRWLLGALQCSHDLNQERICVRSLQEQNTQLQFQCVNYRNCVDEVFSFLVDLNNNVSLKRSQQDRLQRLITMIQEVRKEALTTQETDTETGTSQAPHDITILQLNRELKKHEQSVVMDEEVFSLKNQEPHTLQDQRKTLLQENEELLESLKEARETRKLQIKQNKNLNHWCNTATVTKQQNVDSPLKLEENYNIFLENVLLVLEQDREGIAETLKGCEVNVQQLEKDTFLYKKTSRELKKKLKVRSGESSHQLLASTKCHSAGDKTASQDEAEVASEGFKSTLNTKTNSQPGKIKETDKISSFNAQQNSYELGDHLTEFGCNKGCLSSAGDDRRGTDEAQPSESHLQLPSATDRRETITQFQGVTPIPLSRRELRCIPPSELSLRRFSLGVGVSSIAPDSIEMDKK
ncbi:PREDICTED: kinesin-like protein KIF27 [Chaetura pelagica]|uniref:kinesin-like protein KIF27 n=1 Tax=Chaetura pelagica TaxID=8897 RepID=UPI0005236634|nr:PREDICTED: kinesin-like protein KIF27 [Chaetura pelagica]